MNSKVKVTAASGLVEVARAHVADLRRCVCIVKSHGLDLTGVEMTKAADELEAALASLPPLSGVGLSASEREALEYFDKFQLEAMHEHGFDTSSKYIGILCAALRRLQSPPSVSGEWLPIESAPRGANIWLGSPNNMCVGFWSDSPDDWTDEAEGWMDWFGCMHNIPYRSKPWFKPTHWQPLPTPPADAAEGEGR